MHIDKISNLDKNLDASAHKALEDLLSQVGVLLPESAEAYTTADAQGNGGRFTCLMNLCIFTLN